VRSFGPRVDEHTGSPHARVAQAHDYDRVQLLRERKIGNGTLRLELVTASSGPARRLVRWVAEYTDAGVHEQRIVQCSDELDEQRQHARLEAEMLLAAARPEHPE